MSYSLSAQMHRVKITDNQGWLFNAGKSKIYSMIIQILLPAEIMHISTMLSLDLHFAQFSLLLLAITGTK